MPLPSLRGWLLGLRGGRAQGGRRERRALGAANTNTTAILRNSGYRGRDRSVRNLQPRRAAAEPPRVDPTRTHHRSSSLAIAMNIGRGFMATRGTEWWGRTPIPHAGCLSPSCAPPRPLYPAMDSRPSGHLAEDQRTLLMPRTTVHLRLQTALVSPTSDLAPHLLPRGKGSSRDPRPYPRFLCVRNSQGHFADSLAL